MKQLKLALLALLAAFTFTACDDDDPTPVIPEPETPVLSGAYVINQGNFYGGVDGTVDRISFAEGDTTYTSNYFESVNGQSLGGSPQNVVVYGSRLYVPMYGSNLLWVLNAKTLVAEGAITTSSPEGVCAAGGNVFVTNNDGYVTCIDTLTLTVKAHVEVGPNPAQIATDGQYVYASISDGYNYNEGYANGKKVAVLNAETGEKVKDIAVGVNPGPIVVDYTGNVFVVARGNYADIASTVQKIDATTGEVTDVCAGSLIAVAGNILYVINSVTDWTWGSETYGQTEITFCDYSTQTGEKRSDCFLKGAELPPYPTFITVEPTTGDVYIGSDKSSADYDKQGYIYVYDVLGNYSHRYDVGIHPYDIAFF